MNSVLPVPSQKQFYVGYEQQGYVLVQIDVQFQDLLSGSNRVGNDSNVMDIISCYGQSKTNLYGHKFSFNGCDIYSLDLRLIDNIVIEPNMGSDYCNIVFLYVSISNDSSIVRQALELAKGEVEVLNMFE